MKLRPRPRLLAQLSLPKVPHWHGANQVTSQVPNCVVMYWPNTSNHSPGELWEEDRSPAVTHSCRWSAEKSVWVEGTGSSCLSLKNQVGLQARGKSGRKGGFAPRAPSSCHQPLTTEWAEWAGLVRTCLQPAFLPSRSRENYSPALDFLKPDQRWDPAGCPSKISAMWSLGVSRGETRSQGRGPSQAGAAGVKGQRKSGNQRLQWVPGQGQQLESKQGCGCLGWHYSLLSGDSQPRWPV